DWLPLFTAAGLDLAQFHTAEPVWDSLASADTRAAWEGVWPGTSRPLHVEAAARRGKAVYFSLIGPWTKPTRMNQEEQTRAGKTSQVIGLFIAFVIFVAGLFLAYRNYLRGKVDRQGALRLASLVFALEISICLFRSHFVPTMDMLGLMILALSTALFVSSCLWVLYLALEPYVRRNWPQTIISWTRFHTGGFRDPLVGRDLLFGVLLGMFWLLVFTLYGSFMIRLGDPPNLTNPEFLQGTREAVALALVTVVSSIRTTLVFFFLIVLLRVFVRNRWVAAAIFVLLFTLTKVLGSDHPLIDTPVWLVIYGVAAFAVVRFGLVALAMAVLTVDVLLNVPVTLDFSNWYALRTVCVLLSVAAVAAWGFYTSLGGQRLWKDELFD
ncbi:MAG TPA: hypothetical protein VHM93_26945, partial [Candidatus Acidoferrum sp.]|nr:hypothetical protein [Candidatus Acidoferrum sp.]